MSFCEMMGFVTFCFVKLCFSQCLFCQSCHDSASGGCCSASWSIEASAVHPGLLRLPQCILVYWGYRSASWSIEAAAVHLGLLRLPQCILVYWGCRSASWSIEAAIEATAVHPGLLRLSESYSVYRLINTPTAVTLLKHVQTEYLIVFYMIIIDIIQNKGL